MLQAGAAMPHMTVLNDAGREIDTQDFLGKPLVLWFYPKDDTPG